jgi:hypothetical protein
VRATAPERPIGLLRGVMRAPSACHADPAMAPASEPAALSDRSVRLGTRGVIDAWATSTASDSSAPRTTPATSDHSRPKRGSTTSARQNPKGTYSSTLLNMSLRPARAHVSSRSASTTSGPFAPKRNGHSDTYRISATTAASSRGAAKCARPAMAQGPSGR